LKYGKLKKAGDHTFGLEYMDVGKNLMNTNGYTDFDSQISDTEAGFKGPEVILSNKLSNQPFTTAAASAGGGVIKRIQPRFRSSN